MTTISVRAQTTATLTAGWNLLGNSSSTPINVATTLGDATNVSTVWKWVPATSRWAFYAPSLSANGTLASYAAGKGYDVLSIVGAGEGFWVNAKTDFSTQLPAGTAVTSASFRTTLLSGWNLISTGDSPTAREFSQALDATLPPTGELSSNIVTLWAWSASMSNWYFYAPSLDAAGGTVLADYIDSKGYLGFQPKATVTVPGGPIPVPAQPLRLFKTTGFWVNRAVPPPAITLNAADAMSVQPMTILTLSGTGFDTAAQTTVRFSDGNQYAVDVLPIRITSTTLAVAVPPYFSGLSAVFAPGAVSVKVTQTSGGATRTSGNLAGLQILDLPTPASAPGAVTLDMLQTLLANTTTLRNSASGTALGSFLGSALTDQANALALLINAMQPVVQDSTKTLSLGTYKGTAMTISSAGLRQTDRLILGTYAALGDGTTALAQAGPPLPQIVQLSLANRMRFNPPLQLAYSGTPGDLEISSIAKRLLDQAAPGSADITFDGTLIKLAQASSGGCMQPEAAAYAACMRQQQDASLCGSQAMMQAPSQSTLCSTPGAIGTSLAVVAAGLAGGVAILALGFGTTAVAGTAGVMALAGYLAYATVATGLVQIGIGGTLGQASDAGRQMVAGGVKQISDYVRDTTISLGVAQAAGEVAGIVTDVVLSGISLNSALADAVTKTTSTSTTTTTSTSSTAPTTTTSIIPPSTTTAKATTTTASTTTTTLKTAYCACTFDINARAFGYGGAYICRNTNTWDYSGAALMSYGSCVCDPDLYQVCQ